MSITFLARFAFWFGGDNDRNNPLGAVGLLLAWIVAPLAALLIQMAVSRSREYQADASGAGLSHDPMALASALRKLDAASGQVPPPASLSPAEAHMFIVNPMKALRGQGFSSLFSTHPPTARRIERLESMSGSRSTPFS